MAIIGKLQVKPKTKPFDVNDHPVVQKSKRLTLKLSPQAQTSVQGYQKQTKAGALVDRYARDNPTFKGVVDNTYMSDAEKALVLSVAYPDAPKPTDGVYSADWYQKTIVPEMVRQQARLQTAPAYIKEAAQVKEQTPTSLERIVTAVPSMAKGLIQGTVVDPVLGAAGNKEAQRRVQTRITDTGENPSPLPAAAELSAVAGFGARTAMQVAKMPNEVLMEAGKQLPSQIIKGGVKYGQDVGTGLVQRTAGATVPKPETAAMAAAKKPRKVTPAKPEVSAKPVAEMAKTTVSRRIYNPGRGQKPFETNAEVLPNGTYVLKGEMQAGSGVDTYGHKAAWLVFDDKSGKAVKGGFTTKTGALKWATENGVPPEALPKPAVKAEVPAKPAREVTTLSIPSKSTLVEGEISPLNAQGIIDKAKLDRNQALKDMDKAQAEMASAIEAQASNPDRSWAGRNKADQKVSDAVRKFEEANARNGLHLKTIATAEAVKKAEQEGVAITKENIGEILTRGKRKQLAEPITEAPKPAVKAEVPVTETPLKPLKAESSIRTPEQIVADAERRVPAGMVSETLPPATEEGATFLPNTGRGIAAERARQGIQPPPPPKGPAGAGAAPLAPQPQNIDDAVKEVVTALKTGKKLQAPTRAMQHEERTRRAAIAAGIMKNPKLSTPQAMAQAKRAYGGTLPRPDLIKPNIAPQTQLTLRDTVRNTPKIPDNWSYMRSDADDALQKVFDGVLPTKGEIELLEEIFGPDLANALKLSLPTKDKIYELAIDALNLPRTMKASWDLSAPMRQGLWLQVLHSKRSLPDMVDMVKALGSERYGQAIDDFYRGNVTKGLAPNGDWLTSQKYGLYYAPYAKGAGALTKREEAFMSKHAGKIPGIRASERAYVTYLNKFRQDVWKHYYDFLKSKGATDTDFLALADFINKATGRGNLGALEKVAAESAVVFFSPRMMAATAELPFMIFNKSPLVRKIAMENIAATLGTGTGLLGLAALGGLDVELDPRSADFGKIRIGDARIDFWGGKQQYNVLLARLITGKYKSSVTGQMVQIGPNSFAGDRLAAGVHFTRSKLSPGMALGTDIFVGENFMGESMGKGDVPRIIKDTFAPMAIQAGYESTKAQGPVTGALMTGAGLIGVNTASYPSQAADLMDEWANDFSEYSKIPKDAILRESLGIKDTPEGYRKVHPDVDAKLFLVGMASSVQSAAALEEVVHLASDKKLQGMYVEAIKDKTEEESKRKKMGVAPKATKDATLTDILYWKLTQPNGLTTEQQGVYKKKIVSEMRSLSMDKDIPAADRLARLNSMNVMQYGMADVSSFKRYYSIEPTLRLTYPTGATIYDNIAAGKYDKYQAILNSKNSQYKKFVKELERQKKNARTLDSNLDALLAFWNYGGDPVTRNGEDKLKQLEAEAKRGKK